MYKVKEIFRSIQGEGFNTGKESVFIRFSGCNLWNGIEKLRKSWKQFVIFVILILLELMVKMVVNIN